MEKSGWLIISNILLRHESRLGVREEVMDEGREGGIEGSEGGGGDGSNAVMDEVSFIMDVMDAPYLVNYGDLMLCNV